MFLAFLQPISSSSLRLRSMMIAGASSAPTGTSMIGQTVFPAAQEKLASTLG